MRRQPAPPVSALTLTSGSWRAVGRHDLVEDLAQETFLRVFRGLGYFDARSKLSTWVYTIAHRVALDHLRQAGRMHEEESSEFDAHLARLPALEPGPELALARQELQDLVRRHVEELPDKYRLPLVYTAIDGLDYATVATMLGHPVGTVKTLVFRGKQLLREKGFRPHAAWEPSPGFARMVAAAASRQHSAPSRDWQAWLQALERGALAGLGVYATAVVWEAAGPAVLMNVAVVGWVAATLALAWAGYVSRSLFSRI